MGEKIKKIFWTEPAQKDLQNIYDFYAEISVVIAERQVLRIIDAADSLISGFQKRGQRETLLENYEYEYRYLVKDNYKIIYHILPEEIIIDMVFDTRQNPEKMKRKKEG